MSFANLINLSKVANLGYSCISFIDVLELSPTSDKLKNVRHSGSWEPELHKKHPNFKLEEKTKRVTFVMAMLNSMIS